MPAAWTTTVALPLAAVLPKSPVLAPAYDDAANVADDDAHAAIYVQAPS